MKRVSKFALAVVLAGSGGAVAAQTINQEIARYRSAQFVCEESFQRATAANCGERCLANAAQQKTRCLSAAERRYGAALERALRARRSF